MSTATLGLPTLRPLPRDHQRNVLPLATTGPGTAVGINDRGQIGIAATGTTDGSTCPPPEG